jgi:hypothetical protein
MRVNPGFYALSEEAQLRFRVTMSEGDRARLERFLLKDLFQNSSGMKRKLGSTNGSMASALKRHRVVF